ncbi:MAG: outer membrane protein assembly factor BamD [Candidatus Dasytiphilus stammeri]
MCKKYFLMTIILVTLLLEGCSSIYNKNLISMNQLENIDNYSLSSNLNQIQWIYIYYKKANLALSRAMIERLILMNPNHPNMDYVLYLLGMIDMRLDYNLILNFFKIDQSDRDPEYARAALYDFYHLMHRYPNSKYIPDARKHVIYLKERLAKYELLVADFYLKRCAYVAVINRVKQMMLDYPHTKSTYMALSIMKTAYKKLYYMK